MRNSMSLLLLAALLSCYPNLLSSDSSGRKVVAEHTRPNLQFEANQGQSSPEVKFLVHGDNYALWLTPDTALFSLNSNSANGAARQRIRMRLLNANPTTSVGGEEPQPGVSNYLIGPSSNWKTGVPNYAKVRYQEIYKGIDLVYHGEGQNLEYDFVVKAGADPNQIRFELGSTSKIDTNSDGDLALGVEGSKAKWERPHAYQQSERVRQPISASYRLLGDNTVAFEVGPYDHNQSLVIDPSFIYGQTGGPVDTTTRGTRIAVGDAGSPYIVGSTEDPTYPTTAGAFHRRGPDEPFQGGAGQFGHNAIFVTKLAQDGYQYVYSTFISGTPTTCTNPKQVQGFIWGAIGEAITIDGNGDAFVAGWTDDQNFPVTTNAYQKKLADPCAENNVIVKLNPKGSGLIYSTYRGGTFGDNAYAIDIDKNGNAYITGSTGSTDYPTTPGAFQTKCTPAPYPPHLCPAAFISKLNPTGSALVYSTYLGSPSASGSNFNRGIAVDGAGDAYVAGVTFANDMPLAHPFQRTYMGGAEGYIAKLGPLGKGLVFATYLGGTQDDQIDAIAIDKYGSAFVTGFTLSPDFPLKNAFQSQPGGGFYNAFVTKLSPTGRSLGYSTYLGGSAQAEGLAIVVDDNDHAIVSGYDHASDYPVTADAFQKKFISDPTCEQFGFPGCSDAFLTVFTRTGKSLVYSTLYGGPNTEAWGVTLGPTQRVYISGVTTATANCQSLHCFSPGTAVAFWAKFSAIPAVP